MIRFSSPLNTLTSLLTTEKPDWVLLRFDITMAFRAVRLIMNDIAITALISSLICAIARRSVSMPISSRGAK